MFDLRSRRQHLRVAVSCRAACDSLSLLTRALLRGRHARSEQAVWKRVRGHLRSAPPSPSPPLPPRLKRLSAVAASRSTELLQHFGAKLMNKEKKCRHLWTSCLLPRPNRGRKTTLLRLCQRCRTFFFCAQLLTSVPRHTPSHPHPTHTHTHTTLPPSGRTASLHWICCGAPLLSSRLKFRRRQGCAPCQSVPE